MSDEAASLIPATFLPSLENLDVELDARDLPMLGQYLERLLETNRSFNLTAIRNATEAWTSHILDSLSLLPILAREGVGHVIDVGSGGGLPGIPLAITMPDVTFALVEATGKKAAFLADVVEELALDNVTIIAERAETVGQPDGGFRNAADAVIARAVGPLCVLLELTLPLARVDGLVLAIKGRRAAEELTEAEAAMRVLKGERISCERSETGTVVAIRKIGETPRRFPRRPGEPKRNPIGGTSS